MARLSVCLSGRHTKMCNLTSNAYFGYLKRLFIQVHFWKPTINYYSTFTGLNICVVGSVLS